MKDPNKREGRQVVAERLPQQWDRWINKRTKRVCVVLGIDVVAAGGTGTPGTYVEYRYDEPVRKTATDYTNPFVQTVRISEERFLKNFRVLS